MYWKLDSAIVVMKAAEDGRRYNVTRVLDGAMDRSVLVERPMSPQLVIVGGILRQNPTQVSFAPATIWSTLAPDRSDQPFGEAVPPRCTCLLPAVRAGLLPRFLLTGLGWWGARKRGVPLPCVTSAYITSSHALQRSVTSLRPTTSAPVHVGLPHLRIPQRRSAFFPERSSPFPRR